jgi:cytochrome P450
VQILAEAERTDALNDGFEERLMDIMVLLIFAGTDTTAASINLIIKGLTRNPTVLAALREEQQKLLDLQGRRSLQRCVSEFGQSVRECGCVIQY